MQPQPQIKSVGMILDAKSRLGSYWYVDQMRQNQKVFILG